jgi:hypothetical protein
MNAKREPPGGAEGSAPTRKDSHFAVPGLRAVEIYLFALCTADLR